jgi:hypothetical protein
MDNKLWWAGLSFAVALSTSACGEVESCKEGAEGCFAGPCIDDRECKFDLVCVEKANGDSICGERRRDGFECGREDCDEELGSRCNCEDGELCLPGRPDTCIATYCEGSPVLPGALQGLVPGTCTPMDNQAVDTEPLTYEEACITRCMQNCALTTAFCPGATCDYAACQEESTLDACQVLCPPVDLGPIQALTCITEACSDVMGTSCAEFDCPGSTEPDCDQITCRNTCAFHDDGQCDDGDVFSAAFVDCDWGSDCNDCGPRTGTRPDTSFGGLCVTDASCDRYTSELAMNSVWCVQVEGQRNGLQRCVPDCTDEDEECPEGYVCEAHEADDPDLADAEVRACVPAICG